METLDRDAFDALIHGAGEQPLALAQIALLLLDKGQGERARTLAARAATLAPGDARVQSIAASIRAMAVPDWHFRIVRDERRNAAYDAALRRAIRPGMRVLDIGAGTGLLGMMAARAGASEVISCEMNPAVAAAATRIVAANGHADRMKIFARHSDDLDAERDLGGLADVLVSEIVSNDIVGEAGLPAIEKASRTLLSPSARIIPERATIRVALAEDRGIGRTRMDVTDGFDLREFNELAASRYQITTGDDRVLLRSAPADLFAFDFKPPLAFKPEKIILPLNAHGGTVNGVVQWLSLQMDEESSYENSPDCGFKSCWALLFQPFRQPVVTEPGARIEIHAAHDRTSLRIWTRL